MKKQFVLILIQLAILAGSFYILYFLFQRLNHSQGTALNYALFIGFALFTYINFKKLIRLFRNDGEK